MYPIMYNVEMTLELYLCSDISADCPNIFYYDAYDAVISCLSNALPPDQFTGWMSSYPDETGGIASVSWIEYGKIFSIGWDYTNQERPRG